MSRLSQRLVDLEVPLEERDPREELGAPLGDELGDEAIIAQQTHAHLPQKRASVASEARSVVISQPSGAGTMPYSVEHGEATVVVRDRRSLNAASDRILERRHLPLGGGSLLWGALALIAFAAGGLLAVLSMRAPEPPSLDLPQAKTLQGSEAAKVGTRPPRSPAATPSGEPIPRQVRLEELPLERPNRR